MAGQLTNWAGNVTFGARRLHRPSTVEELRAVVAASDRVRALGTGHSFNRIADTTGDLVSVASLPAVLDIDTERRTVTVGGGTRYGDLATHLDRAGFALPNLGSLPHISVAGACATGTHGSGDGNGNLATAVSALHLVTAGGELATVSRGDEAFEGAVVNLGALGIVTHVTLDLVPSFEIRQYVYDDLPLAEFAKHWAEVFEAGYSVSLFTDWAGPRFTQVWLKRRTNDRPDRAWLGATLADGPRHPVPGMPTEHCTQQLGEAGPWHTRLPHFRLEYTPSSGNELQSEFFVPRRHAVDAVAAIDGIRDTVAPVVQISEVRTIAADTLWLSPCYGRDSVALHFTWVDDAQAVAPVLAAVEEQLAPFAARPHWGKLFGTPADVVAARYERLDDFRRLAERFDPAGIFRNEFLDTYLTT
jgi:xylitol oxidase